ncbi:PDDEXK nuclease domain-containing protein [Chryseobacterium gambrini]|uniref:PDDEXK nuclease domain-containing protein n=1 Tax=Chryseobacterium gambrini TaxID=373672 RepID=A0AAJ1R8M9_9FLAO|nr:MULTISPECIES: PDDEXK nuclease domain-containing protein [Chryseobacterium]MDN4014262.1 PDDEXK nuclease domain-containing protein [Chryseobacterium gambrini]MDN4029741.1 PDDEXK nuclease domain-containing protein [Chryseobacterium gambrini]QWA37174.1 YhcG family protein [Chryseobacterium sp. ZHDP1]
MSDDLTTKQLLNDISALLENARNKVVVAVNQTIVLTYYEIGRMIVEDEQNGEKRAEYGREQLKFISENLTKKFGKGFSETNLKQMRMFFLSYSIRQTVSDESVKLISSTLLTNSSNTISQTESAKFNLSWSHYLKLMRIKDPNERKFYEIESYKNNWSLRELQRQYDSALYARLSLSKNKEEILQLAEKGQIIEKPKDLIKDPYVLEFLGLSEKPHYSENELESELIDKLEHFLLELGTGFTFVARQDRITFDEKQFRIDLVFYNRILRCFVLIDLKIGELKHQDIGQMQMYVNYYDREKRLEGENKTIGIILCQDKSEALVRYTLPEDNEQIFASKYFTILPSKQDFINILNSDNGKIS